MNNNTPHKPRKSRHAKRHAAEQTEPFGFDELETRSQEFRNDRRLRGAQQANADWVAEPLDEWLSCLDAGNTDLGRETMAAFAVGMRETLSIRDALILSLVIDESRCPKSWLMEFAARPHLARTRTRMGELLTCAFEDEGMMPDKERCHTGIGMLLDIAEACREAGNPDRYLKFGSTSKITFPGAGVAALAASPANIAEIKRHLGVQAIGHDKLNQLRHARFLEEGARLPEHMAAHGALMGPKFELVEKKLAEELAEDGRPVRFLAQGTIYPDVIESVSVNGPSATIKSHHNVGGLPEKMHLGIVEPLRLLFKDEVRRVGRSLGISEQLIGQTCTVFEPDKYKFLMGFGQFTADGQIARPQNAGRQSQTFLEAVLALEKNQGAGHMGERLQQGFASGRVARQKAQKGVRQGRDAGGGQGGRRGGRAGRRRNRQALLAAGPHQAVAGVGQQGGARVGNQGQVAALTQQAQHFFLAFGFIVVVKTEKTAALEVADAAETAELERAAGVLGQDQVRVFQNFARPGRKVTRVAKRRGHYPEPGRSQRHGGNAPR